MTTISKKALSLFLVLLVLVCPLLAAAEGAPVRVTDMKGREIALSEPATRIVATAASDCEILYAIGAGDLLVGRGEYCDYPEAVQSVPSVESGSETNLEQLLALSPQIVIMNTMAQTLDQVQALENAGVRVVASEATDIAGVYQAIELLGALTGKTDEAAQVVQGMKDVFASVTVAPTDEPKTVYFEVSPLEYGLWTAGTGTFMDELAQMMGLRNCFDDVSGWAEVSEEQVLTRNPDYIVTISMDYGTGLTPTEEIMARAGWQSVKAVENHAILNLQNNELSRPAPRLAEGAKQLFDFVYGE